MLDYKKLCDAMAELDEEYVLDELRRVMDEGGADAQQALAACQEGMDAVGSLFSEGEYFVSDLIYAGEIMMEAMEIIKPALAGEASDVKCGEMILCTVEGDLHDIGKNIVRAMLEAAGFAVVDLGIDTKPAKIVAEAKARGIKIIALSGVLSLAIDGMKNTIDAFAAEGLREGVKIIIGGCPVNEAVCARIGADAWAHSPAETVQTCRGWAADGEAV